MLSKELLAALNEQMNQEYFAAHACDANMLLHNMLACCTEDEKVLMSSVKSNASAVMNGCLLFLTEISWRLEPA